LPPHALTKQDRGDDLLFYAMPWLVTHIDEGAVQALTDCYRELLPANGRLLDLSTCSAPGSATSRRSCSETATTAIRWWPSSAVRHSERGRERRGPRSRPTRRFGARILLRAALQGSSGWLARRCAARD
jgi:hypothetical protein